MALINLFKIQNIQFQNQKCQNCSQKNKIKSRYCSETNCVGTRESCGMTHWSISAPTNLQLPGIQIQWCYATNKEMQD